MHPLVKQIQKNPRTVEFYSHLLDFCVSSKSGYLTRTVHAQLIKAGFNGYTFLGNRCLELYTRFRCVGDVLKVFDDIAWKNNVSWNICLKGLLKFGRGDMAHELFEEMPERDIVSWNSMFSWYVRCGDCDFGWGKFREMVGMGVKPSGYTYSIVMSMVSNSLHGKELHGGIIRSGLMEKNVVLGNSIIDMYCKLGIVDYAFGMILTMESLDVISWNSLIIGCCKNGCAEMALSQFSLMRSLGYSSDEFTCSAVITCCTNLRNLEKGKQIFAFCIKVGFFCNSIISSALIDLFSKCNRLEFSIQLFKELDTLDSAVCNSMISGYALHDMGENALELLVLMLRTNVRPNEFSLSSVLASISGISVEQGTQIHSLAVKSGFEMDCIVGSSIVHMYAKVGSIDYARKCFVSLSSRDLISWNTLIMGLTHNGRLVEAIETFTELLRAGPPPDRISFTGVLLACSSGGFVEEGISIYSEMERTYGVQACYEHYVSLVDLLCQAGRLNDAIEAIECMPYPPNSVIWGTLLNASVVHENLRLAEKVAERLLELEPHLSLPYMVLAHIYQMRHRWEDAVRVRLSMKRNSVNKVFGCSWIVIKDNVHTFTGEQLQHHAVRDIYSVLELVTWDNAEIRLAVD